MRIDYYEPCQDCVRIAMYESDETWEAHLAKHEKCPKPPFRFLVKGKFVSRRKYCFYLLTHWGASND